MAPWGDVGRYVAVPSEQEEPPRAADNDPGGTADREGVDMHDATEQSPPRQPLAAFTAYRHFLEHAETCPACLASGPCDTGTTLWTAYREAREASR